MSNVFQRGQTAGNSHHRCVNPICSTFSTLVIRPFDFNHPGACVIISIVVLNCISLMTHDTEIFFSCGYFAILLLSFVQCLFKPFAHIFIRLFVFYWLYCLYTLDRSLWLDICIANIFSQTVFCLFIFFF